MAKLSGEWSEPRRKLHYQLYICKTSLPLRKSGVICRKVTEIDTRLPVKMPCDFSPGIRLAGIDVLLTTSLTPHIS